MKMNISHIFSFILCLVWIMQILIGMELKIISNKMKSNFQFIPSMKYLYSLMQIVFKNIFQKLKKPKPFINKLF